MRDPFARDCACITHTGPHWLHDDASRRWAARRHLVMHGWRNLRGFIAMDHHRTICKRMEMTALGVERIPAELHATALAEAAPLRPDAVRRNVARRVRDAEAKVTALAREHDHAEGTRRAEVATALNAAEHEAARVRADGEAGVRDAETFWSRYDRFWDWSVHEDLKALCERMDLVDEDGHLLDPDARDAVKLALEFLGHGLDMVTDPADPRPASDAQEAIHAL